MNFQVLLGMGMSFGGVWLFAPELLQPERSRAASNSSPAIEVGNAPEPNENKSAADVVIAPEPTAPKYAVKIEDATWCVAGVINGKPHCASGFAIDPEIIGRSAEEGVFVVTNEHVIANAGTEPMVSYQGKAKDGGEEFGRGQTLKRDPRRDLALVFIPDQTSPIAKLADALPQQPGQWMKAVGFPRNQPLTIKESEFIGMGVSSGPRGDCLATPPCIQMRQNTIDHGNSGGPLAGKEAELGGSPENPEQEVVIGVNEGETNAEIAIPIDQVKDFLMSGGSGNEPPSRMPPEMRNSGSQPMSDLGASSSVVQTVLRLGSSTAWKIDQGDLGMTAAHVLVDKRSGMVRSESATCEFTAIEVDRQLDLALLKLGGECASMPGLPIATDIKVGDSMAAIGFPSVEGGRLKINQGSIKAIGTISMFDTPDVEISDQVLYGGMSGGPCFTEAGVFGVVSNGTNPVGQMRPGDRGWCAPIPEGWLDEAINSGDGYSWDWEWGASPQGFEIPDGRGSGMQP